MVLKYKTRDKSGEDMDNLIKRINQLTALSRERELTDEEKAEREQLRKQYIAAFRNNLTAQLDNVYYVDDDGSEHKLEKKSNN